MGCCEGKVIYQIPLKLPTKPKIYQRSKTTGNTLLQVQNFLVNSQQPTQNTFNKPIKKILKYKKNLQLQKLSNYFQDTSLIQGKIPNTIFNLSPPKSLNDLAIYYLAEIASNQSKRIQRICLKHYTFLVNTIKQQEKSLRDSCLALVYFSLKNNSVVLKMFYIKEKLIEAVVPLLNDSNRFVRILAAGICARLYYDCLKGQHQFIRNKGEFGLVKLLKQEQEDSTVLGLVVEYLIDLVVVEFIQDVEGCVEPVHVERVLEAGLLDVLSKMDMKNVIFKQKSFENRYFLNQLANLLIMNSLKSK